MNYIYIFRHDVSKITKSLITWNLLIAPCLVVALLVLNNTMDNILNSEICTQVSDVVLVTKRINLTRNIIMPNFEVHT